MSFETKFCWLRIADYPLWAWHQIEPSLKNQELLVGQAGRVLTCTPALRELGVMAGMAVERAVALTSQVKPVVRLEPGERGLFLWEEVLEQVYRYTPRMEEHRSPGCLLAELEASPAEELAASIPVCAGWAFDRQTAYLASLVAQDGQLCKVPRGEERRFRDRLSCLCLVQGGVSIETVQRLIWLGFPTVGSLLRLSPEQLRSRFGDAEVLLFLSRPGENDLPVSLYRPPEVLGVAHVFEPPWREAVVATEVLELLLPQAMATLGERVAAWVGCRIQDGQGQERVRRRFLKLPTALPHKLRAALRNCWEGLLSESLELEKLTFELGGLRRKSLIQATLFQERSHWSSFLPTFQSRFPGKLLRIEKILESAYLPEESFALRELSTSPRGNR